MNRKHIIAFITALTLVGAAGCGRNARNQGPMERSGKAVDNAAEKVGEGVERAGEKMQGQ